jgi:menaquinone-dependent protoporphyrinogen oxidase
MARTPRVLVAYATAAGSTAGIAERITAVLTTAGCEAVCRPAAPDLDLAGFDGFVVGSAVQDMAWLPAAVDLLERVAGIRDRPVWCFSVGGVSPGGRFTRYLTRKEAARVEQQFPAAFTPREHRVFGGIVEMRGVPLRGRLLYRITGAHSGDHRDWPAIEAWARNVAAALTTAAADSQGTAAWQYRPPEPPAGW